MSDSAAAPLHDVVFSQQDGASAAPLASESVQTFAPLHRVIDVSLSVTLRFGQRRVTLREVLDLNTGSLLELDRQVEEPVDLVLGDRIIARGEVIIIDGNYGMRVTEVLETSTASNPPCVTATPHQPSSIFNPTT